MSKLPRPVARQLVSLRRWTRTIPPDVRQMIVPSAVAAAAVALVVAMVPVHKGPAPVSSAETAPASVADGSIPASVADGPIPASVADGAMPASAAAGASTDAPPVAAAESASVSPPPAAEVAAGTEGEVAKTEGINAAAPALPKISFAMPPETPESVAPRAAQEAPDKAPASASADAAPSAPASAPSFHDDRAMPQITFEMPAETPAASASDSTASAPTSAGLPSFRDDRGLAENVSAEGAADTKTLAAGLGTPSFTDARPLSGAAEALPPEAASASFRDDRRLTVPSFQDNRLVVTPSFAAPSFVDPRPAANVTFRDDRPVFEPAAASAKSAATAPAGEQVAAAVSAVPAPAATPAALATPTPAQPETASTATAPAPPAAASSDPLPTLVALAPGQIKIDGGACVTPEVTTEPLDGGTMLLKVAATCHPNEFVQISYGGAEFIRKLNTNGNLDFILDCFAGTSSAVEVRFADGVSKAVPVVAKDLDKVSKIAVIWRAGVNLDLHVFEYAAGFEQPGHLWSRVPSSFGSAQVQSHSDGRGHGFLSATDDDKSLGDKLEVYTFLHNDQQSTGSISLALDNQTRGEMPSGATCGQGALAEIAFHVSILPRNSQVSRQSGVLTRVDCGTRLTHEARFNQSAMPALRIRK